MQVILDSSFARPGSAPIWGGKKGEFRDWTMFHANVRSLKRNFENLQTHLLNELEYSFNIIGITETRILKMISLIIIQIFISCCWRCWNVY